MIYLIGLIALIGLSIWLWGEATVKKAIKIILGLLLFGIIAVIAFKLIEDHQKKENKRIKDEIRSACLDRSQRAYDARPICPKSIRTFEEEEKNQCKIDWNLLNDHSQKQNWEIERLFKSSIECAKN